MTLFNELTSLVLRKDTFLSSRVVPQKRYLFDESLNQQYGVIIQVLNTNQLLQGTDFGSQQDTETIRSREKCRFSPQQSCKPRLENSLDSPPPPAVVLVQSASAIDSSSDFDEPCHPNESIQPISQLLQVWFLAGQKRYRWPICDCPHSRPESNLANETQADALKLNHDRN